MKYPVEIFNLQVIENSEIDWDKTKKKIDEYLSVKSYHCNNNVIYKIEDTSSINEEVDKDTVLLDNTYEDLVFACEYDYNKAELEKLVESGEILDYDEKKPDHKFTTYLFLNGLVKVGDKLEGAHINPHECDGTDYTSVADKLRTEQIKENKHLFKLLKENFGYDRKLSQIKSLNDQLTDDDTLTDDQKRDIELEIKILEREISNLKYTLVNKVNSAMPFYFKSTSNGDSLIECGKYYNYFITVKNKIIEGGENPLLIVDSDWMEDEE